MGLLKPGISILLADNILMPGAPKYLAWVKATPARKREILQKTAPATNSPKGADFVNLVKQSVDDAAAAGLENVPGNPNLVYETQLHEFEVREGRKDAVAITKVVGIQET